MTADKTKALVLALCFVLGGVLFVGAFAMITAGYKEPDPPKSQTKRHSAPAKKAAVPSSAPLAEDPGTRAIQVAAGVTVLIIIVWGTVSIVALMVYLLPIGIAIYRGHPDTLAITLTNVLLGGTGVGWCIALIWSVKQFRAPPP